jgi:two-component system sensor histidine kinase BaeS
MASALQRMRLYEQTYGLTELRLYAIGIILWLGVVFVWFSITVLRGRRSLFAVGALVAGFAATAALNVANPDALIARTNVDRPRIDVAYVAGLSDDAIPALLEALPSLRPDLRQTLAVELLRRSDSGGDWRSFNLARARASSLLAARHDELLELAQGHQLSGVTSLIPPASSRSRLSVCRKPCTLWKPKP